MDDNQASQIARHVPRMYRVAMRLLRNEDQAHDAVQEACLKALARLREFDGRSTMVTWLHRITVNCAMDMLRSQRHKETARAGLQGHLAGAARQPSPAETVETRELTDLAWRLWEQLPQQARSAFALTQFDGYSYDEAAEIEGEPRGTIASRVFRAKRTLLEQMNAQTGGPDHDR